MIFLLFTISFYYLANAKTKDDCPLNSYFNSYDCICNPGYSRSDFPSNLILCMKCPGNCLECKVQPPNYYMICTTCKDGYSLFTESAESQFCIDSNNQNCKIIIFGLLFFP